MKPERIEAPICKECEDRPAMVFREKNPYIKLFTYICPSGHKKEYGYKFPIQTTDMGKTWIEVS